MREAYIQTNFTAGELSPRLLGHINAPKYRNGLASLINGIILTQGPVRKRNGFQFIYEAKYSDKKARLVTFQFSGEQWYVMEFGHYYIRFYHNGGILLKNDQPYEVVTVYSDNDVDNLKFAQSADIVWIVHPDHQPHMLKRYGHTNWKLEKCEFNKGPWYPESHIKVSIENSGRTGEISLIASPEDGPELVVNGGFNGIPLPELLGNNSFTYAPDDKWTWGAGWEHDYSNLAAKHNFGTAPLSQNINIKVGKIYRVSCTISGMSGGSIVFSVGGSSGSTITDNGIYTEWLTAINTNGFALTPADTFNGVVEVASVKETLPDNAWTWGSGWTHDIGGNKAKHTSGTDELSQNVNVLEGKLYKLSFKVSGRSSGSVTPYLGNNAGITVSSNITSSQKILADNNPILRFVPTNDFNGSISAVSLKEDGDNFDVFLSDHVGSLWNIVHENVYPITAATVGNPTIFKSPDHGLENNDIVILKGLDQQYWSVLNGLEFDVYVIDKDTFSIKYNSTDFPSLSASNPGFIKKFGGICVIKEVQNGRLATANVISTMTTVGPTKEWREHAWSNVRGYPRAITFHEGRLILAGSKSQPQTIWMSSVDDYNNFRLGSLDSDALSLTLSSDTLDIINWLSSSRVLLIGTAGGMFRIMASTINEPITPTNFSARKEINWPTANISPAVFIISNLVVSADRTKIGEVAYNFELDSYILQDMQVLSEHINREKIKQICLQTIPDNALWCVLEDGTVTGLTYQRSHEVVGWHRHQTDGKILSITTVRSGATEYLYALILRGTKQYIEAMELSDNYKHDEYPCLDSYIAYSGYPATILRGLDHLEGRTVCGLLDGVAYDNLSVHEGEVVLPVSASKAIIGLPYEFIMQTMPIEAGAREGVAFGKKKRSHAISILVKDTNGLQVAGSEAQKYIPLQFPGPYVYSDVYTISLPENFNPLGQIVLYQKSAYPAQIMCLVHRLVTYDQ